MDAKPSRRTVNPSSIENLRLGRIPRFRAVKRGISVRISQEAIGLLNESIIDQPTSVNRSTMVEALIRALFDRPSELSWNDLLAIADGCKILREHQCKTGFIRVWSDPVESVFVVRDSQGRERGETKDMAVAEAMAANWAKELG